MGPRVFEDGEALAAAHVLPRSRRADTPAGTRRSRSISSASATTCVCARSTPQPPNRPARFLEDEALRLDRTASLLARARGWPRDEHVLAPADSVLRRGVGAARQMARALLTQRMAERLSAPMRDRLDALLAVDDDLSHSPLNPIKASSSKPSVGGMKRLLASLELIEATGVLEVHVGWVNGNYQRILFHSVRTASANRLRRMRPTPSPRAGVFPAPDVSRHARPSRRYVRQAPPPQPQAGRGPAPTTCSQRNATPSTGSFTVTASSARCCSTPTSATTSCAACRPLRRRGPRQRLAAVEHALGQRRGPDLPARGAGVQRQHPRWPRRIATDVAVPPTV